MLLAVGAWATRRTRQLHLHQSAKHGDHAHRHTHAAGESTHHYPPPASTALARTAALAVRTAAGRSLARGRWLGSLVGVAGILVGVWWIGRAVG